MTDPDDSHRDEIANRLARIAGHAISLKRLWEEDRSCVEMLTQIAAVRAGLEQAGRAILDYYVDHRIADAFEHGRPEEAVDDLKEAISRLL